MVPIEKSVCNTAMYNDVLMTVLVLNKNASSSVTYSSN